MVLVLFRFSFIFINIFTHDICTNKKPEHDTVFTVLSVILQGYTGNLTDTEHGKPVIQPIKGSYIKDMLLSNKTFVLFLRGKA